MGFYGFSPFVTILTITTWKFVKTLTTILQPEQASSRRMIDPSRLWINRLIYGRLILNVRITLTMIADCTE